MRYRIAIVDLRQLRYFVTLAETRNFHRAAERLNMSQPPLTVAIRKLEEELGTPLFVRGTRGVTLSPAGEAALEAAQATLAQAARFRAAAREGMAGERGRLRVGFCPGSSRNTAGAIRRWSWCWKRRPAWSSPASWSSVSSTSASCACR
jgi:DNA-binding transcriptional LysR family regulator